MGDGGNLSAAPRAASAAARPGERFQQVSWMAYRRRGERPLDSLIQFRRPSRAAHLASRRRNHLRIATLGWRNFSLTLHRPGLGGSAQARPGPSRAQWGPKGARKTFHLARERGGRQQVAPAYRCGSHQGLRRRFCQRRLIAGHAHEPLAAGRRGHHLLPGVRRRRRIEPSASSLRARRRLASASRQTEPPRPRKGNINKQGDR